MRARGRPRLTVGERRYPNRLRELRDGLGLPQEKIAAEAGISVAYYGALERGDKRINADTAQRLHVALRCAAGDLFGVAPGRSIALRIAIAATELEGRPDSYDLPPPHEWLQPRPLPREQECFAAEIFDDSADLDFARGAILFVREQPRSPSRLPVGARIVVRFLMTGGTPGAAPATREILYGLLDQNIVGDLVLVTRTGNRLVPRNALIQSAAPQRFGLGERALPMIAREAVIEYEKRPEDPGEILGVVIYAMGPA